MTSAFTSPDPAHYDEHGCLKPGIFFWLVWLFLSRGILLPFVAAGFGRGADGHMDYLLQSGQGALWDMLGALPALLVGMAWSRRLPTARSWVRWIWRYGRWWLMLAATVDMVVRSGWLSRPRPDQTLWWVIDLLIVVALLRSRRIRQLFDEFPAPMPDAPKLAHAGADPLSRAQQVAKRLARFDEDASTRALVDALLDPTSADPAGWDRLALRAVAVQRYADAEALFTYLETLAPHNAAHPRNRCEVLRRLHRPAEAVTVGKRAIQINPEDALAHFNLAVAAADAGDAVTAHAHCLSCLQLAPDFAPARDQLARWTTPGDQAEDLANGLAIQRPPSSIE